MATYEFDVMTEAPHEYPEAQQVELDAVFQPLKDQGVTVTTVTLRGDGGDHSTVRLEGDSKLIRDHMRPLGWDQETDEMFEQLYRVDRVESSQALIHTLETWKTLFEAGWESEVYDQLDALLTELRIRVEAIF